MAVGVGKQSVCVCAPTHFFAANSCLTGCKLAGTQEGHCTVLDEQHGSAVDALLPDLWDSGGDDAAAAAAC